MSSSPIKRPAPFPIRFNPEERAFLEGQAGERPLGTYIRSVLLDGKRTASKTDYAALGRALGLLGKSELASSLCALAVAAESGSLYLDDEADALVREACEDVKEIRLILIKALGLRR